jgi:cephalosporin hydroxylase
MENRLEIRQIVRTNTFLPMDFEQEYFDACNRGTDIHEHLPWLSDITSKCRHVTELGVGHAQSTRAFLRHDIELHSYEIQPYATTQEYFESARNSGRNVTLHICSTLETEIEPTDMMLVDSYHSYEQVVQELKLHANKVRKYIFFHDTTLYGDRGQGHERGIWPAIDEFLSSHSEWELLERRDNNNGMTLIGRRK